MDVRRVVQVWVRHPDGTDGIGSGYLLTDSVVLTAAHVLGLLLEDRPDGRLTGDDVLVQSHFAGRTVPASRALRLGGDIAVLVVDRPFVHSLGPAPVRGTVGLSALVLTAVIVGYPELELQHRPGEGWAAPGEDDSSPNAEEYRRDRQLDGEISGGTGFGDGTLTVHLAPRHFPQSGSGKFGSSAFMGLSGSAIFIGGHLVGVVTEDPHPDHPTVVVGQRLDPVTRRMQLPASMSYSISAQTCQTLYDPAVDVSKTAGARAVREAHLWQARTILQKIPGGRLRDRGAELAQMARFCLDTSTGYLVWHAYEWSGKSALLATFVVEPPAGIDIVAFFINSNDPDARTADRYLASLIGQLEAYLDIPHEAMVTVPGAAAGRYVNLLARAAAAANDNGRRLVLVVDALDEDEAFTPQTVPTTRIAELLPADVTDLLVIAATRPYAHVLMATPAQHPFRATASMLLSASPHAADIRDEAAREVRNTATGTDVLARSILAFLHAAEDDLTPEELAELVSLVPGNDAAVTLTAIRARLQTGLHRTVWQRGGRTDVTGRSVAMTPDEAYGWAHATLPKMVMDELGPRIIRSHAEVLHDWASDYHSHGWRSSAPQYLESGYPRLLASTGRAAELTAYALDDRRHRWLHARRGGNDQALWEIGQAARLLVRSVPLDVGKLVLLAFERDRLEGRYEKLPTDLPAVWAKLGNIRRAEVLARSMPADRQAWALAEIASTLATGGKIDEARLILATITGEDRAAAATHVACALAKTGQIHEAESTVGTIMEEDLQAGALCMVVQALVGVGNIVEAERVARDVEHMAGTLTKHRAEAMAAIAVALAAGGNAGEVQRIAGEAERLASDLTDEDRVFVLGTVACALADSGSAREFKRVANEVKRLASASTGKYGEAQALTMVARAWAKIGRIDKAERFACAITSSYFRSDALAQVACALVEVGRIGEAERLVGTLPDGYGKSDVVAKLACALAEAGHIGDAKRIAGTITDQFQGNASAKIACAFADVGQIGEAKRFASAITEDYWRAEALTGVARALTVGSDTAEAELMADEVERIAGAVVVGNRRADALTEMARALAAAGRIDEAERLAGAVPGKYRRADAVAKVACALAEAGHIGEAQRVAGTFAEEYEREDALVRIACVLAAGGNTGEAEHVARMIASTKFRLKALTEVARALVTAGKAKAAEGIAREIRHAAKTSSLRYNHGDVLAAIAGAFAAVGSTEEVERIAIEAERFAGTTSAYDRSTLLAVVARALAEIGNVSEAERIADAQNEEYNRDDALAAISRALAEAGNAAEAERIAGAISAEYRRAEALTEITRVLAKAGEIGVAERVASTIPERNRPRALAEVALAMAAAGHVGEAERVAREAERIANTLTFEDDQLGALAEVIPAMAAAGHSGEAERIACGILVTGKWSLAVSGMLNDWLVKAAVDSDNGWLTVALVTQLIEREHNLPSLP